MTASFGSSGAGAGGGIAGGQSVSVSGGSSVEIGSAVIPADAENGQWVAVPLSAAHKALIHDYSVVEFEFLDTRADTNRGFEVIMEGREFLFLDELAAVPATNVAGTSYRSFRVPRLFETQSGQFSHSQAYVARTATNIYVAHSHFGDEGPNTLRGGTVKIVLDDPPTTTVKGVAGSIEGGTYLTTEDAQQVYAEDDYRTIRNVEGTGLVEVGRANQSAHGKVATPRDLTDDDFVGIVGNVHDLSGQAHGKFFFDLSSGFVIRLTHGTDGFTAPTGYYAFDPMGTNDYLTTSHSLTAAAAAGPWRTAPSGGSYSGALAWRGSVQTAGQILAAAEELGDVIVVPGAHRVVYIDVFSAATKANVTYPVRRLVPRYFNNPTLTLWGSAQSTRIATAGIDSRYRYAADGGTALLKWKLDDGEIRFGASSDMVKILTAAEAASMASSADNLPPAASRGGIFLNFLAGVWTLDGRCFMDHMTAYTSSDFVLVNSGRDAIVGPGLRHAFSADEPAAASPTPHLWGASEIFAPELEVAADEVFYVNVGDGVNSSTNINTAFLTSQFLRCIYHGPD